MNKVFFFLIVIMAAPAWAQPSVAKSKQPVEIEASRQLEWIRDKNVYRATGDVVITQGTTVIRGDTAEAQYDAAIGPSALTVFTVTGNVSMSSDGRTIKADKAIYDTRSQELTLSGNTVTLTTETITVTSHDGMEYNAADGKAIARGKAEVKDGVQTLKADIITAWMQQGTNKLHRATASGNVLITHQGKDGTDIAQARNAAYDAVRNTVDLKGDVKLTRGANHMQGDHATVDLTTGTSSLQNNAATGGRVRAIFTPGDSSSPLPNVKSSVPMIESKKQFEQPYAVGR
jgi:lipopolysaccharide export system protein LptA